MAASQPWSDAGPEKPMVTFSPGLALSPAGAALLPVSLSASRGVARAARGDEGDDAERCGGPDGPGEGEAGTVHEVLLGRAEGMGEGWMDVPR